MHNDVFLWQHAPCYKEPTSMSLATSTNLAISRLVFHITSAPGRHVQYTYECQQNEFVTYYGTTSGDKARRLRTYERAIGERSANGSLLSSTRRRPERQHQVTEGLAQVNGMTKTKAECEQIIDWKIMKTGLKDRYVSWKEFHPSSHHLYVWTMAYEFISFLN